MSRTRFLSRLKLIEYECGKLVSSFCQDQNGIGKEFECDECYVGKNQIQFKTLAIQFNPSQALFESVLLAP